MNFNGIIIGAISFLIIGIFHPIVIKAEYYWGKKVWPLFLLSGIFFLIVSFFMDIWQFSCVLGLIGFSCLWSIHELFEQERRVKKGWFPRNPNR